MAAEELPFLGDAKAHAKLLALMKLTLKGDGGIECRESPDGSTWTIVFRRAAGGDAGSVPVRRARVTAKTPINGSIRWRYTIRFGHWDLSSNAANGGTWVDDSGGKDSFAFSMTEDMNTFTSGTGAIGTGNTNVAQADGTINGGSCALLPIPVGSTVGVILRGIAPDGTIYWDIVNFTNSAQ